MRATAKRVLRHLAAGAALLALAAAAPQAEEALREPPCRGADLPCMPPAVLPVAESNVLLERRPYRQPVAAVAKRYGLDPALVHAVIMVESNYRSDAISPAGAIGLMQVMPDTGVLYGIDPLELHHPEKNLRAGARFLADLLRMFGGNLELALAGYHAGPYAVLRNGGKVPNISATRAYIPRVLGFYDRLRGPVVSTQLAALGDLAERDSKQP